MCECHSTDKIGFECIICDFKAGDFCPVVAAIRSIVDQAVETEVKLFEFVGKFIDT